MARRTKYLLPVYLIAGALLSYYFIPEIHQENKLYSDLVPKPEIHTGPNISISGHSGSEEIYYSDDGGIPSARSVRYYRSFNRDNTRSDSRCLRINSSPIWRAPYTPGFPLEAKIIRAVSYLPRHGHSKPAFATSIRVLKPIHLPVLSLAFESDDMFDPVNGKMTLGWVFWTSRPENINSAWWEWEANYTDKGRSSDIFGAIELLDTSGVSLFTDNVRIRFHGNTSRAYPQKSFRISPDEVYGTGKLTDPMDTSQDCGSFLIRNSGNDWGVTQFSDAFMHHVSRDLNVLVQRSMPVHVLLNGVYWGVYNIRDRFDDAFLDQHAPIKGRLAVIEMESELNEGKKKDLKDYKSIASTLKSDKPIKEKTEFLLESCDLDHLYDYFIVQTFFGNTDWPSNNNKAYRHSKKDKWKWLVYDLDYGMAYDERFGPFERLLNDPNTLGCVFRHILADPGLRQSFISRYRQILKSDFSPGRLIKNYNLFVSKYEKDITYHIARWRKPSTFSTWLSNVGKNRTFLKQRHQIILKELNLLDGNTPTR